MLHAASDRALSIYNLSTRERPAKTRELFTRLSTEAPVHWDRYAGTWLISHRAEAMTVCTSPRFRERTFNNDDGAIAEACPVTGVTTAVTEPSGREAISRQTLFLGEPLHGAWRPLLRAVLSTARVAALEPWIERRIAQLVGNASLEQLDVVADIARPLPFEVMAHLFGLPPHDLPEIRSWSDAYTRIVTGFAPSDHVQEYECVDRFLAYILRRIHMSRSKPGNDGLSILVGRADKLGIFSDVDIAANLIMLVSAAHQTTTGFIAGAVLETLNPSFGPLPVPPASEEGVEELLARVSPSRFVGRMAAEDTELGSRQLQAGQSVLVLLGAINWHELAKSRSARAGSNVAFGLGRHHCPGARLARLEGRLVLEKLFTAERRPVLHEQSVQWSNNVNLPCPERVLISVPN